MIRFKAGDRIGEWEIVDWLGEGRSGSVWEVVERTGSRRRGALKINDGVCVTATASDFCREADFVEAQPLPGFMPACLGRGECEDGVPYFVMELAARLPERLGVKKLKALVVRLSEALMNLHARNLIHCDVKRENVGVIGDRYVLLDYGSVRKIGSDGIEPVRVGTWKYMAPEVREKAKLDARADVYSLGALLQELSDGLGRRCFETVVINAMKNDLKERTQTVAEFLSEFKAGRDRLAKFAKITAVMGCVVFLTVLAWCVNAVIDYRMRRTDQLQKHGETMSANAHVTAGLRFYMSGDMANAVRHIGYGMFSKDYAPEDFRGADVKGIYEDALRRTKLSGL